MKKLLPRNTTIPVRKSDIFSTSENNQTVVEIHVLQGEREMASDNKSLGRFKLSGIPPAPRGIPQVQVAFDIDANGILQVTARDKTTGREQSITVQGSSTLSDLEVNRMIQEAESFASEDRERRERIEKRNSAKALTDQAQRRLKEVTLDFGSAFTVSYRRQVDSLSAEILESLEKEDERRLDRAQADLQDVLYELNREVRLQYQDEDEGFFSAIRKTFTGDFEDDEPYGTRRSDYRDDYAPRSGVNTSRDRAAPLRDRGASYRSTRRLDSQPKDYRDSGYGDWEEPPSRSPRNDNRGSDINYSENYDYRSPAPRRPSPLNSSNSASRSRLDERTNERGGDRRNDRSPNRNRPRNLPPENNWDDDDDDWF